MKAKLAKLIDVKSIMTLLLTLVFCIMALCGVISGQEFLTIFTVIVGFYFGTQSQKTAQDSGTSGKPRPTENAPVQEETVMENAVQPEAAMDTLQPPDEMAPVGYRY